jgi:hypothetical protein
MGAFFEFANSLIPIGLAVNLAPKKTVGARLAVCQQATESRTNCLPTIRTDDISYWVAGAYPNN